MPGVDIFPRLFYTFFFSLSLFLSPPWLLSFFFPRALLCGGFIAFLGVSTTPRADGWSSSQDLVTVVMVVLGVGVRAGG